MCGGFEEFAARGGRMRTACAADAVLKLLTLYRVVITIDIPQGLRGPW